MATNNSSGAMYDSSEYGRLKSFLDNQQSQMDLIDKEKRALNKKVFQYAIILTGSIVTLVIFSKLVKRI